MNFHRRLFRLVQFFSLGFLLLTPTFNSFGTEADADAGQEFFDGEVGVGYRAVGTEGEPGRAGEYTFLHFSAIGSVEMHAWKDMLSFSLLGDYENEADYHADLELNNRGKVRLWISTRSLFHNLDHFPFNDFPDAVTLPTHSLPNQTWVDFEDSDPGDDYFVEVEQNNARLRVKAGSYPAHFNLEYWRLGRTGREQLRFVNHGRGGVSDCNDCHVRSQSRTIDQVTEEVKGSIDVHLGYVDIIAEQLYREFRDREPIPFDAFPSSSNVRSSGSYQHDERPDSRLISSTVKAHTSLSGGVVGAAGFTIGKRENQSDLSDIQGVKSETDFRMGTADVAWILSPQWTVNLLYRLLDLDNSNSSILTSASEAAPVEVRDNVDLTRASYAARIAYRPTSKWTFKGDFEHKKIHRGNVGAATLDEPDPVWELPKEEEINRLRLTALGRPLGSRKLKLNLWYEYLTSEDPAYGASAEESHEGFAGVTWSLTPRFGMNASIRGLEQLNRNKTFSQHSFNSGTDDTLHFFREDRRQEKTDVIFGSWWNPAEPLTLTFNYGFLRTRTLQDQIFSSNAFSGYFVQDDDLENSQRVHSASAGMDLRIMKNLGARLEWRFITTFANWNPRFSLEAPAGILVDSQDLKEATRLDIRQAGASLGVDWSPTDEWTCSLRYTFDDYEDRDSNVFDGTVQTYMASVSRFW